MVFAYGYCGYCLVRVLVSHQENVKGRSTLVHGFLVDTLLSGFYPPVRKM